MLESGKYIPDEAKNFSFSNKENNFDNNSKQLNEKLTVSSKESSQKEKEQLFREAQTIEDHSWFNDNNEEQNDKLKINQRARLADIRGWFKGSQEEKNQMFQMFLNGGVSPTDVDYMKQNSDLFTEDETFNDQRFIDFVNRTKIDLFIIEDNIKRREKNHPGSTLESQKYLDFSKEHSLVPPEKYERMTNKALKAIEIYMKIGDESNAVRLASKFLSLNENNNSLKDQDDIFKACDLVGAYERARNRAEKMTLPSESKFEDWRTKIINYYNRKIEAEKKKADPENANRFIVYRGSNSGELRDSKAVYLTTEYEYARTYGDRTMIMSADFKKMKQLPKGKYNNGYRDNPEKELNWNYVGVEENRAHIPSGCLKKLAVIYKKNMGITGEIISKSIWNEKLKRQGYNNNKNLLNEFQV